MCTPAQLIQISIDAIRKPFLFFAYSRRPLLDDANIYTSTLILYNSLNYNLIDAKLGTIVHILIFSIILLSYMPKNIGISVALIVDM